MKDVELSIEDTAGGLTVTMPPARNHWIIGLGLGAGIPYLLVIVAASVAVPLMAPDEIRRQAFLGVIAINLLFFFLHVLAVLGAWLAFYDLTGVERLVVTADGIAVRRTALGMTLPIKLGRRGGRSIKLLDTSMSPGKKVPHPRLEVRAGGIAARFGAGLTAEEAERVRDAVAAVLEAGAGDAGAE